VSLSQRYVSTFDYEGGQVRCPPYNKGTLVEKILGLRTHWPVRPCALKRSESILFHLNLN
jgi:hypothetical protein